MRLTDNKYTLGSPGSPNMAHREQLLLMLLLLVLLLLLLILIQQKHLLR